MKMEKFFLRDGRWACFPVFSQALRRPHRRDSRLWRFPYLRLDTLQNALFRIQVLAGRARAALVPVRDRNSSGVALF